MKKVLGNWLVGIALSACTTAAMAAPIAWSPVQNSLNLADVETLGSLVEAVNATTTAVGNVTVNGVEFTNASGLLGMSFSSALSGSSTGDTGYDALLNTFNYGGGTSTSIELASGQLMSGLDYIVQVWFTDLRSNSSSRNMTYGGDGGASVVVNASGTNPGGTPRLGQYATGLFTADSSSQSLMLATDNFPNAHISAYQVRSIPVQAVPVPGTLLLLGLGLVGLGLLATRREV